MQLTSCAHVYAPLPVLNANQLNSVTNSKPSYFPLQQLLWTLPLVLNIFFFLFFPDYLKETKKELRMLLKEK